MLGPYGVTTAISFTHRYSSKGTQQHAECLRCYDTSIDIILYLGLYSTRVLEFLIIDFDPQYMALLNRDCIQVEYSQL